MSRVPYMLSRPMRVVWNGWESTTVALQRAGWQFAVEREDYGRLHRLVMKNQAMSLVAITDEQALQHDMARLDSSEDCLPVWRVACVAPQIMTVNMNVRMHGPLVAVDMEPHVVEREMINLADLPVFRKMSIDRQAEEIVVEQADMTVIEHLEAIKALQSEKQRELRASAAREDVAPEAAPERQLVAVMANYRKRA